MKKTRSHHKNPNTTRGAGRGRTRAPVDSATGTGTTTSGPAHPAAGNASLLAQHANDEQTLAAAMPFNASKAADFGVESAKHPAEGATAALPSQQAGASTLSEVNESPKTGAPALDGAAVDGSLQRLRVNSAGAMLTTNQGVPIADNQNSLKAGLRGPHLARRLRLARENHAFRSRADSGADRARARVGGARLLRSVPVAFGSDDGHTVHRSRKNHAGVRALLHGCRRTRVRRHRARRARLRGQVLHRPRQLGPRRQQHSGVFHPRRDEIPGSDSCRETGAAQRYAASRKRTRHILGFCLAEPRVDSYADVGHVGSRHSAQLSHDARLRHSHVSPHQCRRRFGVLQVSLEAEARDSLFGSGTKRSSSPARIRIFIAAIFGKPSSRGITPNGNWACRRSPKSRPRDSPSTSSIRPS